MGLSSAALAAPAARAESAVTVLRAVHEEADGGAATETLAGYGRELLDQALAILVTRQLAGPDGPHSELTALQREVLLAAVARLSSPWVVGELEKRYRPDLDLRSRHAFLAVLESCATAWDLGFLTEVATPPAGASFTHQELAERFVLTLRGALSRREVGAGAGDLIADSPAPVRRSLVTALGVVRTTHSLELLGRLLGVDAALDRLALQQIWLTTRSGVSSTDPWLIGALEERLDSADSDNQLFAAQALGHLGASASFPRLVDLLDDGASKVSTGVLSTLRELSGQSLPGDSDRWRVWLAGEREWAQRHLEDRPVDLSRLDAGAAAQRINEYSRHTFYREPLGPVVASALGHPEPQIRRLAASGLRQLEASGQSAALVPLLDDDSADVRAEALASLRALTGLDLPADPELWMDASSAFGSP